MSAPEPPVDAVPEAAAVDRFARWVSEAPRILFVTGAGISADSGLPTYRGVGGLYDGGATEDGVEIEEALSGAMMVRRPALCWKYIHQVEQACRGARPNRGHEVIAWLEQARRREDDEDGVVVLTQNVDGLHRAAGSEAIIEIHGNVHALHCTRCDFAQWVPDYADLEIPPSCPRCAALVRPRVVLFGEMLHDDAVLRFRAEMARGFDLVVVVGTTAVFPYIAEPVQRSRRWGAKTVEINPGHSVVSDHVDLRLPWGAAVTMQALATALGLEGAAGPGSGPGSGAGRGPGSVG